MRRDGAQLGRVAAVRDADRADTAVRPWLRRDPLGDLAQVGHLGVGPLHRALAGRRATAARVHQDQGIAGIVPLVRHLDIRDTRFVHADQQAVDRSHGVGAPVARGDHDRRQPLVGLEVRGHPDVSRQAGPVAHGHVARRVARMAGRNDLLAGDRIEVHEIEENGRNQAEADETDNTNSSPAGHCVTAPRPDDKRLLVRNGLALGAAHDQTPPALMRC